MLAQISFTLVNVFHEGLKPFMPHTQQNQFSSFLMHQTFSEALLPCSKQSMQL